MRVPIEAFFFDRDLRELGLARRASYRSAVPYPHIVMDDFLPRAVVDQVVQEFPPPDSPVWSRRSDPDEVKLQSTGEEGLGPHTRQLLNQFNSSPFLAFLEALTGIDGLVPDPHYVGGGLHQIEPGGFLQIHADFNRHDHLKLDRRLNLLLYLNPDWPDDYGGHFEMWDADIATCRQRILPVLNRCVVFSTTSSTYHGHPEPLRCPPGRSRRSLALYYYTSGRPRSEQRSRHTTLFLERPGETGANGHRRRSGMPDRAALKRWVPPAVGDWVAARRRGS